MSENSSINASPQGISEERLRAQIEPAVRERIRETILSAPAGSDKKEFLIENVTAAKSFFEGGDDLLEGFLNTIRAAHPESDAALEETASRAMTDMVVTLGLRISPLELQRRFRERENESEQAVALDEEGMFTYTRYENTVQLHIKGFGLETVPTQEKAALLRTKILDALNKLAEVVRADENIDRVNLTSWIVGEHPLFIKKLGFSMVNLTESELQEIKKDFPPEMRGKTIGVAEMNRGEFLKKYGV